MARHGTQSGWAAHMKAGERPCDPCYWAKAEYDKRRLAAPEKTRLNRLHARAQARANSRLRRMYPTLYQMLYEEEKARLFREDREVWGSTSPEEVPPPQMESKVE